MGTNMSSEESPLIDNSDESEYDSLSQQYPSPAAASTTSTTSTTSTVNTSYTTGNATSSLFLPNRAQSGSLRRHPLDENRTELHLNEESLQIVCDDSPSPAYSEVSTMLHNNSSEVENRSMRQVNDNRIRPSFNSTFMEETSYLYDIDSSDPDEMNPYFDVTRSRLRMIFQEYDVDRDGKLNHQEFRRALEHIGIRCSHEETFAKLLKRVDKNNTNSISHNAFDGIVIKLKLSDLFVNFDPPAYHSSPEKNIPTQDHRLGEPLDTIEIVDYSVKYKRQYNLHPDDIRQFLFSKRPEWIDVRWINILGYDDINLRRFCLRYQLHPLSIEDVIMNHKRPKIEKFEDHLHIIFPVLVSKKILKPRRISHRGSFNDGGASCLETSATTCPEPNNKYSSKGRSRTWSECSTSNMRIFGKEYYDDGTATRRDATSSLNEDVTFELDLEYLSIFVLNDTNTVLTMSKTNSHNLNKMISKRLNSNYSRLRYNDSRFLLYGILDVIVDQIMSVLTDLGDHLISLENDLVTMGHRFPIYKLRGLKNQLFQLPRVLKPAKEVLKNLLESSLIPDDTKTFIRDVHDHLVQALDDVEVQLHMCRLIHEDFREAKANRMNYVVYTLTLIASIFLPAQFLTGVYGMNFENMPELKLEYGYLYFWLLVIGISVTLQCYFHKKKWIVDKY